MSALHRDPKTRRFAIATNHRQQMAEDGLHHNGKLAPLTTSEHAKLFAGMGFRKIDSRRRETLRYKHKVQSRPLSTSYTATTSSPKSIATSPHSTSSRTSEHSLTNSSAHSFYKTASPTNAQRRTTLGLSPDPHEVTRSTFEDPALGDETYVTPGSMDKRRWPTDLHDRSSTSGASYSETIQALTNHATSPSKMQINRSLALTYPLKPSSAGSTAHATLTPKQPSSQTPLAVAVSGAASTAADAVARLEAEVAALKEVAAKQRANTTKQMAARRLQESKSKVFRGWQAAAAARRAQKQVEAASEMQRDAEMAAEQARLRLEADTAVEAAANHQRSLESERARHAQLEEKAAATAARLAALEGQAEIDRQTTAEKKHQKAAAAAAAVLGSVIDAASSEAARRTAAEARTAKLTALSVISNSSIASIKSTTEETKKQAGAFQARIDTFDQHLGQVLKAKAKDTEVARLKAETKALQAKELASRLALTRAQGEATWKKKKAEKAQAQAQAAAATQIQSAFRMHHEKSKFLKTRSGIVKVQAALRGFLARKRMKNAEVADEGQVTKHDVTAAPHTPPPRKPLERVKMRSNEELNRMARITQDKLNSFYASRGLGPDGQERVKEPRPMQPARAPRISEKINFLPGAVTYQIRPKKPASLDGHTPDSNISSTTASPRSNTSSRSSRGLGSEIEEEFNLDRENP